MTVQAYDLIGDIHGYAEPLKELLDKLGYRLRGSGDFHPDGRKVVFLGDFVDRGPNQREVVTTVRAMLESGNALAVMGNHEFNAIAYATPNQQTGQYLRPHSQKHQGQHEAFLREYGWDSTEHKEAISWFKTLPLWLDLGGLRVVHACWDKALMRQLETSTLTDELLFAASQRGSSEYLAIETLLKGKELPLRNGVSFKDKEGNVRHEIRVRWWDKAATSLRDVYIGPESARTHIPEDDLSGDHLVDYSHDEPPVFLGHYWLEGIPEPLAINIACLDYSVAKPGGKLVAYRWDGEQTIDCSNFIWVERRE